MHGKRLFAGVSLALLGAVTGCAITFDDYPAGLTGSGGGTSGGASSSTAGGGGDGASASSGGIDPNPPVGIGLQGLHYTAQAGTPDGGLPHEDACPSGQVVIGYQGYLDPGMGYHAQLQARCGTPAISGGGPYAVTITPAGLTPPEGNASYASLWTRLCAPNQAIVGFSGRSGAYIDLLRFDCASLLLTGAPGSYLVSIGATTVLPDVGDMGPSSFDDTRCPKGEVATENHLRSGDFIDAFGLGCSKPVVTY